MNPAYHLFVVEDNDDDFEIWLRALRQAGIHNAVERCTEGKEALQQLKRSCADVTRTRPTLIVLELHMPSMDGRKLLQAIKADPELQMIPVVVWSTSTAPADIEYCHRHAVNGYLRKPGDITELTRAMEIFVAYWLKLSQLPSPRVMEQITFVE